MDTSKLKKFASFARTSLMEQVGTRLKSILADQSLARRESAAAVAELEKKIKELGKDRVIDMVAYTWFNRFCALRFMDVNQYTTIGTVSPAEGFTQPEILTEAKQGVIDEELKVDRAKIIGLLDGTRPSQDAQGEVYQQLLIAVCNSYHKLMPFMFEKIADYTELLIPEDLLSDSSVLAETRKALTAENCTDVEVIGWLYQFYISEKKDDVFAALKKGEKITPENIPAATQLFTPHWIVRYLVENSLGRLWMLNHPDSKLVERMDYYIKPEEPEADFLRISSPEEIKTCDPACGSGHMLTYAFDLLYAIYEEQGYQATDIPRLILKHNLYGVEIDQRAGALAAFALVMKARQKDRRFFARKPLDEDSSTAIQNPNVCVLENIQIDPDDLSAYMDKVGRDLFSGGLQGVVNQWEEADNFGSLIRPVVADVSDVLELLRERQMGQDLFLADVHQKVLKALRQADYLSPKYHVVVANPPYLGSKGMNPRLGEWLKSHYSETKSAKSDLFAIFLERCVEFAVARGQVAMITMQSWMFLSSYEKLRTKLLTNTSVVTMAHFGARAFDSIGGDVVSTTSFVLSKRNEEGAKGVYFRLVEGGSESEKSYMLREAISNPEHHLRYEASKAGFRRIPSSPVAYWVTPRTLELFDECPPLGDLADARVGLLTSDNDRFLRYVWEVSKSRVCDDAQTSDEAEASGKRWFPHNKGGASRKWAGNQEFLVNWESNGREIKELVVEKYPYLNGDPNFVVHDDGYYFLPAVSWSEIGSGGNAFRLFPSGYTFNIKGMCAFAGEQCSLQQILAYCNTNFASMLTRVLNPTLSFGVGDFNSLPGALLPHSTVCELVDELVSLSQADWDSLETSAGFTRNQLLENGCDRLGIEYEAIRESHRSDVARVQELEVRNNVRFNDEFGLSEEMSHEVPFSEITLLRNPLHRYGSDKSESELESLFLADTMREFISYAVGCMFGRYSLDKPGLILANQGETADIYRQQIPEPTFAPDEDNVIPLLDGDWFEDDISERFKAFLKVTFGTEHYEENLTFLENALYPENVTGKKRKTIRDYLLKDFYNHHIKLYKKRPIYWLFSSPKGTFNALIYMHRYRPDTVGTVLHYLRDFRDKLTHHADHQQMLADSASASKSEKTQAIKDVAAIKKQLKELEDYEKTLFEVAARKIDIDLDDGVKHNYLLFSSVLRKIPGLDAKED